MCSFLYYTARLNILNPTLQRKEEEDPDIKSESNDAIKSEEEDAFEEARQ